MSDTKFILILVIVLIVSLGVNAWYVVDSIEEELPFSIIHNHALESKINYTTFSYSCNDDEEIKRCLIFYFYTYKVDLQADMVDMAYCGQDYCKTFGRYEKFSGGIKNKNVS